MLSLAYPWVLALSLLPLLVRWLFPAYRESRAGLFVPSLERVARLTRQDPSRGAVVMRQPPRPCEPPAFGRCPATW